MPLAPTNAPHCAPTYSAFGNWTAGTNSTNVTPFAAETGRHVTVTDGSASGTSAAFDASHASLHHFNIATVADQTAGNVFSVSATAVDQWDNPLGADYHGSPTLSGNLHGSTRGCPGAGNQCTASYGTLSLSNGVATWTGVTAYLAETLRTVTATDGVSGTSNTFTVKHNVLQHFTLGSVADQTAGVGFTVTATAEDMFENPLGGDYTGTPTLSGTLHGSTRGCSGAGNPCTETYGNPPTVSNGVATWNGVKGYLAETLRTVTATDGVSGTSDTFTVIHNSLDHFTLGSIGQKTAGVGFTVTATAEDMFENPLGGDYTGTPTLSGTLHGSPRGCPGAGNPCTETYGNPPTVSNGVATWNGVKGYLAETLRTVTATDGVSGTSDTFTVKHNVLDHFTLSPVADQTAGVGFSVTATAEDLFENPLGTDYTTTPTLSGTLHGSPRGCPGAGNACTETYANPASVSNGVATWTGVKGYKAETLRTVTATDGNGANAKTGTSNTFTVGFNVPFRLSFASADGGQQPTDQTPNTVINPAVKVYNEDQYGNPEVGVAVTVSLQLNTSGATLTGTLAQNGNSAGVSTFADLKINKLQTNFKLRATSGSATTAPNDSAYFNIANVVVICSGACSATATNTFANVTVNGTATGKLSITLETPGATCAQITNPSGDLITVNPQSATGAIDVTGTLLHRNNKGGVGNLVFCKNTGPATPFHPVQDCNKQKTNLPCLVKKSGNGQGDVTFEMLITPTDPAVGGGH